LLYTHPGGDSGEDSAARTLRLIEQGFTALKYDPFAAMHKHHTAYINGQIERAEVRLAAEFMNTVRAEVGPDIDLMIDFHGCYNSATALACIQALGDLGITWFEEPFPPEGIAALRHLRARTQQPLCVGERLYTRWDFLPILTEGLVNYVMPDVCWTGGITELKKISTLAETYFVPVAPHGAMGPLQATAAAHVMITTPNFYRLEILEPSWIALYNEYLTTPLDIVDGRLRLSNRPGLGIELDMDMVRSHPDLDWAPQRAVR
jgi:galactonate dehydratase